MPFPRPGDSGAWFGRWRPLTGVCLIGTTVLGRRAGTGKDAPSWEWAWTTTGGWHLRPRLLHLCPGGTQSLREGGRGSKGAGKVHRPSRFITALQSLNVGPGRRYCRKHLGWGSEVIWKHASGFQPGKLCRIGGLGKCREEWWGLGQHGIKVDPRGTGKL